MTDMRKVWPKEPLTAVSKDAGIGTVQIPVWDVAGNLLTDDEFAAAFVDAAVLTELVDAAREWRDAGTAPEWWTGEDTRYQEAFDALLAALAAFDAAMLPDTETPA